jgi:hypothetical protein
MKRRWLALGLVPLALLPLTSCISVESLGANPLDFECTAADIGPYLTEPFLPPEFGQIQRDAGHDFGEAPETSASSPARVAPKSLAEADAETMLKLLNDPLYQALATERGLAEGPRQLLLLSGGGQWGAFGAGFLDAANERGDLPDHWDVVTGVSTGAIQSLFVAIGAYRPLLEQYTSDGELARPGSLFSALFKGHLNDTQPLRARLEQALCEGDTCTMLRRIAESRTRLLIGMVEARTGDFRVLDVTRMLADAYPSSAEPSAATKLRMRDCVVGATMASSAVPVQLRAARLRVGGDGSYRTFTDGGVRLSVFETYLGQVASLYERQGKDNAVEIRAVRNGPTVVEPSRPGEGETAALIDRRPNAYAVAMKSYATLVNQNEVMSIAALRLNHSRSSIRVATADGFNTPADLLGWRRETALCPKPADKVFDHDFMVCLAAWGRDKALHHPEPWITLDSGGSGQ